MEAEGSETSTNCSQLHKKIKKRMSNQSTTNCRQLKMNNKCLNLHILSYQLVTDCNQHVTNCHVLP